MTPLVPACCLLLLAAAATGQKCPKDKVNKKQFYKFTETTKQGGKTKPVADAPCWFDLTRSDCGRCKNGGKQCGAPMERWCQNPRNKNGCDGVPNNKYTLSSLGGPCYWDLSSLDCAVCKNSKSKQCGPTSQSEKCGSMCNKLKAGKCDGNLYRCDQIPRCGPGASCKKGACQCDQGLTGNGQQCFSGDCSSGNCTLVSHAEENVEISIDTNHQYFIFTADEL